MGKPRKQKRKGPKSTRAGCLLCKPHKDQRVKDTGEAKTRQELRADAAEEEASEPDS
ncbi:MAG: hypothetical protein R3325_09075 [Thermoanaerobaculia bacterium]|nr:hypothetical protein [Thermoanaerobaculia bacterium]